MMKDPGKRSLSPMAFPGQTDLPACPKKSGKNPLVYSGLFFVWFPRGDVFDVEMRGVGFEQQISL
jgi:hypothetical protein